jgi:hypothetical protein
MGIIDQNSALIITPLFITQAPTCVGIHMLFSGSVLDPEFLERQKWLCWWRPAERICAQLDNVTHKTTTGAHRPPTFTVHDYNTTISAFQVTHKD